MNRFIRDKVYLSAIAVYYFMDGFKWGFHMIQFNNF